MAVNPYQEIVIGEELPFEGDYGTDTIRSAFQKINDNFSASTTVLPEPPVEDYPTVGDMEPNFSHLFVDDLGGWQAFNGNLTLVERSHVLFQATSENSYMFKDISPEVFETNKYNRVIVELEVVNAPGYLPVGTYSNEIHGFDLEIYGKTANPIEMKDGRFRFAIDFVDITSYEDYDAHGLAISFDPGAIVEVKVFSIIFVHVDVNTNFIAFLNAVLADAAAQRAADEALIKAEQADAAATAASVSEIGSYDAMAEAQAAKDLAQIAEANASDAKAAAEAAKASAQAFAEDSEQSSVASQSYTTASEYLTRGITNPGFEDGEGLTGVGGSFPLSWEKGELGDFAWSSLGFTSPHIGGAPVKYASKIAFGSLPAVSAPPMWSIFKMLKIEDSTSMLVKFQSKITVGSYDNIVSVEGQTFISDNDSYLKFTFYDLSGLEIEQSFTKSASHYAYDNGDSSIGSKLVSFEQEIVFPAETDTVKVELVAISGTDTMQVLGFTIPQLASNLAHADVSFDNFEVINAQLYDITGTGFLALTNARASAQSATDSRTFATDSQSYAELSETAKDEAVAANQEAQTAAEASSQSASLAQGYADDSQAFASASEQASIEAKASNAVSQFLDGAPFFTETFDSDLGNWSLSSGASVIGNGQGGVTVTTNAIPASIESVIAPAEMMASPIRYLKAFVRIRRNSGTSNTFRLYWDSGLGFTPSDSLVATTDLVTGIYTTIIFNLDDEVNWMNKANVRALRLEVGDQIGVSYDIDHIILAGPDVSAAASAAIAAKESETNAEASASAASQSASLAETSKIEAKTSESQAGVYLNSTASSQTSVGRLTKKARHAATAATEAQIAAETAASNAEATRLTVVQAVDDAEAFASAAEQFKLNAETAAGQASVSATSAATSATDAQTAYNSLMTSTRLADIEASVTAEQQARIAADGSISAKYGVKVDVNGYVSGFGLISTANNAVPTSEFVVLADKFKLVAPGQVAPQAMFSVGQVNGQTKMVVNGDVIADGSISGDKMLVGSARNMLFDPSFELGLDYWSGVGATGGTEVRRIRPASEGYAYGGEEGTVELRTDGVSGYMTLEQYGENGAQKFISVEPGKRYEISCYLKTSSGNGQLGMQIAFLDLNGTYFSGGAQYRSSLQYTSTTLLSTFTRVTAFSVAPANAVYARAIFYFYPSSSAGNKYLFLTRPQFAEAYPNQTEPSHWSNGKATLIENGLLATDAVIARNIKSASFETRHFQADIVEGQHLKADSVSARHINVGGTGAIVSFDPNFEDTVYWSKYSGLSSIPTGADYGPRCLYTASSNTYRFDDKKFPIEANKDYVCEWIVYQSGGNGLFYGFLQFWDASGNLITSGGSGWPAVYEPAGFYYHPIGVLPPAAYTKYQLTIGPNGTVKIPAGAVRASFGMLTNYNASVNANVYIQRMQIQQRITGELVVNGSITVNSMDQTNDYGTLIAGGSTLNTVKSNAALGAQDPAVRINTGATTINGGKLTTGTVTADKINVNNLAALNLKVTNADIDNLTVGGEKLQYSAVTEAYLHTSTTSLLKNNNSVPVARSITVNPYERLIMNLSFHFRCNVTFNSEPTMLGYVYIRVAGSSIVSMPIIGFTIDGYAFFTGAMSASWQNGASTQTVQADALFFIGTGGSAKSMNYNDNQINGNYVTNDNCSFNILRTKK